MNFIIYDSLPALTVQCVVQLLGRRYFQRPFYLGPLPIDLVQVVVEKSRLKFSLIIIKYMYCILY